MAPVWREDRFREVLQDMKLDGRRRAFIELEAHERLLEDHSVSVQPINCPTVARGLDHSDAVPYAASDGISRWRPCGDRLGAAPAG